MAYLGNSPAAGENNSFKILDSIASYTLTFNGSSASVVSLADDTITKNEHRFITGQRVTYTHGGGTQITGLTSGSVYYIVKNDQNSIKLAPTYSDAISSTNLINLSGLGSGSSHTLNVAFDGINTKFKATYDNGTKAGITRAAQLQISINGVIQQPHDSTAPPSGFGYDLDSTIVFSTAPVSTDVFWGNLVANNFPTFDISDNDIDNFTGNASTTSFTLSKTPVNSQNILVTLDGVVQYPSDNDTTRAYTLAENVLTFVSAPGNGVLIQVRHIGFAGATTSEVTGFYGRTGNVALRHIDDVKVGDVESIGISTFTVSGVGTVTVGSGSTTLLVDGDARVTGILTVGNTSLTLDGVNNKITIGSDSTFIENGVIGIGTTNAENHALNVSGTANISGNATIGGSANVKSLDYAGISSSISDTAVDVFVYDTRKDSDGGAWRKRTQNTSWYNETLGTATRGSRKEFPAVAVIVAEATQLTIYDGDDPDLPMWMVFNLSGAVGVACNMLSRGGSGSESDITSVAFFNAKLVVGLKDVSGSVGEGLVEVNFISDFGRVYREVGSSFTGAIYNLPISGRNSNSGYHGDYDSLAIIAQTVNDVAMTVLPNAPIDDATGLPVPTIAVGTDNGVSVIKDDGTVVDIRRTSDDDVHHVDFDSNRVIMFMELGAIYVATISGGDQSGNPNSAWTVYGSYGGNTSGTDHPAVQAYGAGVDLVSMKDHTFATAGFNDSSDLYKGLSILSENLESSGNGMVAWIRSDCNTGYMHGDIKGAFLSDNDTTNIANHLSGNLINYNGNNAGDFNSADDLNAWTGTGLSHDAANSRLIADKSINTYFSVDNILTIGKRYELSWDVASQSPNYGKIMLNSTTAGSAVELEAGSGTGSYEFTANDTDLDFYLFNGGSNHVANINSITIVPVVEDRSINNNGLQVFGTITKSAVATGADLVGYSGFSGSNLLVQPYNSDLDPGTGDYSFMCWFKCSPVSGEQMIMRRFSNVSVTGGMMMRIIASNSELQWYVRDTSSNATAMNSTRALDDGLWHCAVGTRQGTNAKLYIDGKLDRDSTCSANSHDPGTTANLVIGAEETVGSPGNFQNPADLSSLALVRYSLSAPSPEQIKKMYEDEKHLFQENAKATLYGSSNAVTALAYDEVTKQLHAGTSAGRSDFLGLRRINNTTTAVTTAISAHDGLIAQQ